MIEDLQRIKEESIQELTSASSKEDLEAVENKYLNKKAGIFPQLTASLATLSPQERASTGQQINEAKTTFLAAWEKLNSELTNIHQTSHWLDITLPPEVVLKNSENAGALHPISQTIREITRIFEHLGFARRRYREIDSDYYAFEALNLPKEHPARAEWETFYLEGGSLITPHTSNGQVREMEEHTPPLRMINISRCGRRQEDISHAPSFYQFEGLLVDKQIAIPHLKGVLDYFVKNFFGADRKIRLRPYNFCFTEPSFEIDIDCGLCSGKGCRTCKEGWLELGGAGMVHPNVLRAGKIDPKEYTGFAFGWGVERVFMMKNPEGNIADIRELYRNDLRFLEQFA